MREPRPQGESTCLISQGQPVSGETQRRPGWFPDQTHDPWLFCFSGHSAHVLCGRFLSSKWCGKLIIILPILQKKLKLKEHKGFSWGQALSWRDHLTLQSLVRCCSLGFWEVQDLKSKLHLLISTHCGFLGWERAWVSLALSLWSEFLWQPGGRGRGDSGAMYRVTPDALEVCSASGPGDAVSFSSFHAVLLSPMCASAHLQMSLVLDWLWGLGFLGEMLTKTVFDTGPWGDIGSPGKSLHIVSCMIPN